MDICQFFLLEIRLIFSHIRIQIPANENHPGSDVDPDPHLLGSVDPDSEV